MPEVDPNFPRAWVEFPDTMFRVDLTWLTSGYKCIFGEGCKGIYEDAPNDGCCTLGAHFTEPADLKNVSKYVKELTPETWQKYDPKNWTETSDDGQTQTRVVDGACIFSNKPDFAGGYGCALHHLAERKGLSHVDTKPEVCWQVPIKRSYRNVERADETEYLEVTIGEFDRASWGDGGHDFDWYCTNNTEAHISPEPLYKTSESELRELMGDPGYDELVRICEEHMSTPQPTFIHLATKASLGR